MTAPYRKDSFEGVAPTKIAQKAPYHANSLEGVVTGEIA
jgi:hypothetical protein